MEPLERWPRAWQGVLEKLFHRPYNHDQTGVDEPATLLSRLQRALRAAADGEASTSPSNSLAWEADGSVIIARTQTSLTDGADFLHHSLHFAQPPKGALQDNTLAYLTFELVSVLNKEVDLPRPDQFGKKGLRKIEKYLRNMNAMQESCDV